MGHYLNYFNSENKYLQRLLQLYSYLVDLTNYLNFKLFLLRTCTMYTLIYIIIITTLASDGADRFVVPLNRPLYFILDTATSATLLR